ncbi:hypothetical protein FC90_GL001425 [Latilactobacillus graminis DSM 20719]|uniref:Phosphatidylglycerol lysyltransferase n=2 Tax=Latilactobacillus graminis TaxID=60519 RepID=A0AA89I093_9LACO|nr:hypothetical protein FC90_GL001425 [Latilactobacillus graminis DSM 20719]
MLLIGCGIFAYESRTIVLKQLVINISHLKLGWLLVALLCMLVSWLFEALVLRIFLKGRTEHFSLFNALRIPLIAQLFNAITPFSSGGQPAQLVALMQSRVEAGQASSVLLMKFIVYQFMVLVNFLLSMSIGFSQVSKHFDTLSILITFGLIVHVVVLAVLLLIMYYNRFTKQLVDWLLMPAGWFVSQKRVTEWRTILMAKIDTFYAESLHLKREKKKLIKGCFLTLGQLFFYYSVPYFVLLALGIAHVNYLEVIVLHIMIVMIVSLFPVPGGSGGAEYSFKTLFATFIPSSSKLVLGMLLWRLFTYYLGMFMGIGALAVKPRVTDKK